MPVEMRKILDKYFLPCFYGVCVLGLIIAAVFFLNVKQQQKDALLASEPNLNIKKANETLKLEKSENITSEELIYTSSDESIIQVDKNSQNSILLFGGANQKLNESYVDEVLSNFESGDILLLQNEVNLLPYIVDEAYKKAVKII